MNEKEIFEAQFLQFVSSLYSTCMFQLGKIMNPVSGKIEKDLSGARATIDMLRMIEVKTKGNLSPREREALESALSNMQMNYVDEVKREQEKKKEPDRGAEEEKKEQKAEAKKSEEKKTPSGRDSKGRIIIP
ncbi:MAG TPA: DUF1844 domain-containing protein [Candidatus Omnitrophica bacterium]|nr:DUF1844 domain-containing protein [Candidatus Omnitrophota bacterium]